MSREPSSPMMRGWRSYEEPPAPPPKPKPKPGKRKFKVRVEKKRVTREQALTKLTTTTEALTAEERGLLRELREVGPETAGKALSRIQQAKKEKEDQ